MFFPLTPSKYDCTNTDFRFVSTAMQLPYQSITAYLKATPTVSPQLVHSKKVFDHSHELLLMFVNAGIGSTFSGPAIPRGDHIGTSAMTFLGSAVDFAPAIISIWVIRVYGPKVRALGAGLTDLQISL